VLELRGFEEHTAMEVHLAEYLSINRILFSSSQTKENVMDELIKVSREDGKVGNAPLFKEALLTRESIMSTGIGYGVAIPHVKLSMVKEFFITIFIHKKGVNWDSLDNQPVHIILLIAGPENQQEKYLRILARLVYVIKNPDNRKRLLLCNTKYEVYSIFNVE
jgi:fructose-specific phosphotransferase system IIA component